MAEQLGTDLNIEIKIIITKTMFIKRPKIYLK